jgi:hypothetical protein
MKQKRVADIYFSIKVEIPEGIANTMKEGPGPALFCYLDAHIQEALANLSAQLAVPWRHNVGPFELVKVEEHVDATREGDEVPPKTLSECKSVVANWLNAHGIRNAQKHRRKILLDNLMDCMHDHYVEYDSELLRGMVMDAYVDGVPNPLKICSFNGLWTEMTGLYCIDSEQDYAESEQRILFWDWLCEIMEGK